MKKNGRLDDGRIKRLDAIGFTWQLRRSRERAPRRSWEQMFQRLAAVRNIYGHCNVPADSLIWGKLANWIATQRSLYRRNKLTADQIIALESAGFRWNVAINSGKDLSTADEKKHGIR